MTSEPTRHRRRRASIARRLAAYRDAGDAADGRWRALSWRTLDTLPDWCALDPAALRELRALAGAVSLLPAVRRCLRGDVLSRLSALIGAERLEALRRRPYRAADVTVELDALDALDARLAARGARVLVEAVEDPLARLLLLEALRAEGGTAAADDPEDAIDPAALTIATALHRPGVEDIVEATRVTTSVPCLSPVSAVIPDLSPAMPSTPSAMPAPTPAASATAPVTAPPVTTAAPVATAGERAAR